jgi:hypothetical protein
MLYAWIWRMASMDNPPRDQRYIGLGKKIKYHPKLAGMLNELNNYIVLETISLDGPVGLTLHDGFFAGWPPIKRLEINNPPASVGNKDDIVFEVECFRGLDKLEELDLWWVDYQALCRAAFGAVFRHLPRLTELAIRGRDIGTVATFELSMLAPLQELKQLVIGHSHLDLNLVGTLNTPKLSTIIIRDVIKLHHDDAFKYIDDLTMLKVSNSEKHGDQLKGLIFNRETPMVYRGDGMWVRGA